MTVNYTVRTHLIYNVQRSKITRQAFHRDIKIDSDKFVVVLLNDIICSS